MDWIKLKNLVKQNGDKFVFMENGEPEAVMMSFHEYQKLFGGDADIPGPEGSGSRSQSDLATQMHSQDANVVRQAHRLEQNRMTDNAERDLYSQNPHDPFVSLASNRERGPSVGLPVRLEDIRLEDLPI